MGWRVTPIPRAPRSTNTSSVSHRNPVRRRGLAAWVAYALLLGAGACTATAVRPYITPFPLAPVDTLQADAAEVIRELTGLVTAEGLQIRTVSPEEGYLETGWYDVVLRTAARSYGADSERYVRLRFFADPTGQALTQLVSEAVVRRTLDPSVPERQAEMLAPPGHQGDQMLTRMRDALRTRYGGATP